MKRIVSLVKTIVEVCLYPPRVIHGAWRDWQNAKVDYSTISERNIEDLVSYAVSDFLIDDSRVGLAHRRRELARAKPLIAELRRRRGDLDVKAAALQVVIEFLLDELDREDLVAQLFDARLRLPDDLQIEGLCRLLRVRDPILFKVRAESIHH